MLKRAALALGVLLSIAGCPGPEEGGKDASVRKDASSGRDAEEIIIGEDSGVGPGLDAGPATGIGWCNVQFPASATIAVGAKLAVFGQVFVADQTSQTGVRSDIEGQLGYGAQGTDGSADNSWTWTNAAFNKDDANNDEYKAEISPALGSWGYAYRFRYKNGPWAFCDLTGSADGYDKSKQGALTVTPVVPPSISWCKVVSGATATAKLGQNALVYGQVLAAGVTDATGQGAGIVGEVGYGPLASDPTTSKDWLWSVASFNKDMGNNDEYEGRLAPASPGKYAYAYRFHLGTGEAVYCDTDQAGTGFSKDKLGTLDVTELTVDWCALQFPPSANLTPGADFTAYGQVLVTGTTDQIGAGADVEGELGVGAAGSNGSTDLTWTWTKAAFNKDDGSNDEYKATVKAGAVADYAYAYRFRFKSGAWTYCDLDSTTNGFAQAQQGALTVATVKPKTIDWCNVQFPATASVTLGGSTSIFGQVFVAGVTEAAGAGLDVVGEVGIGPTTVDASAGDGAGFTWTGAAFSKQDGNNDEFVAALTPTANGDYAYAYRFKYQGGAWTYCDLDSSANGFAIAQQGKLTVAATKPSVVDWCAVQWPPAGTVTAGTAYTVYGQVWVNGATEATGQGASVEGQLGVGTKGSNGSTDATWTWIAASYGKDVGNNDEYQADLEPAVGDYSYAYRFRYKGGAWTYCDLDSSNNGYDVAQQGALKVDPVPAQTVDFCVLQWPPDGQVVAGTSFTIYGQVYKAGVTNPAGKAADVTGEYGYGAAGTDGSADATWKWAAATFNADVNNNDEYLGELNPGEGNWAYAYRFKYLGGAWTYCDLDGSTNAYSKTQQGLLTVTAQTSAWVQMRPLASDVENAGAKLAVAAEIFLKGVTDADGQGAGVTAEVGYGTHGVAPTEASWTWAVATYQGDAAGGGTKNNDVYGATLVAPSAGSYDVAVRFTVGGKTYVADADAATDGFQAAEAITLTTFAEPATTGNDVGWCNVQWPAACTAAPGATSCTETPGTAVTSLLYGRVYLSGISDHVGSDARISAQLGVGSGSPRSDLWTWTAADWNADADAFAQGDHQNDEYKAAFAAPAAAGAYRYVFRFRLSGGAKGWTYCDTDGAGGSEGFDPAKSGALTVQ